MEQNHYTLYSIKIDGFIRISDGTRYLTLIGSEKYDIIYYRIRYLVSLKSSVTYIFSYFSMLRFGETKVTKKVYASKKTCKTWDVNVFPYR